MRKEPIEFAREIAQASHHEEGGEEDAEYSGSADEEEADEEKPEYWEGGDEEDGDEEKPEYWEGRDEEDGDEAEQIEWELDEESSPAYDEEREDSDPAETREEIQDSLAELRAAMEAALAEGEEAPATEPADSTSGSVSADVELSPASSTPEEASDDKQEILDSLAELRAAMEAVVAEDEVTPTPRPQTSASSGELLMGEDYDSSKSTLIELAAQFDELWKKEGYGFEEDYVFVIGSGQDKVDGEYLFVEGREYLLMILCFGKRYYDLSVSSDYSSEEFGNQAHTDTSWTLVPGFTYGAHTLTVPYTWMMNLQITTKNPNNPTDGSKSMAIVKVFARKAKD